MQTEPDPAQDAAPIILAYIPPGLPLDEIHRRTAFIAVHAQAVYGVTPDNVIVEPQRGRLRGFNELIGAIKFYRQARNKNVIVMVVTLLDFGAARTAQRWAKNCILNLGATIEFAPDQ